MAAETSVIKESLRTGQKSMAPLDAAIAVAREALGEYDGVSWYDSKANRKAAKMAEDLRSLLAALDADKRLEEAEGLLLDVWDAHHREGWEPTETEPSVIDRLGDWRWNAGYDPFNPPLRTDPRKGARREGEKGKVPE